MADDHTIAEAMESLGIEVTDTNFQQFSVMLEAMQIFTDRNAIRNDLWQSGGYADSMLHVHSKSERMRQATIARAQLGEDPAPDTVLDDALDLVNYAVFFVRNVRGV